MDISFTAVCPSCRSRDLTWNGIPVPFADPGGEEGALQLGVKCKSCKTNWEVRWTKQHSQHIDVQGIIYCTQCDYKMDPALYTEYLTYASRHKAETGHVVYFRKEKNEAA